MNQLGATVAQRDARVRGMTLIEVLVALAIVAITLSAGIKAAGGLTLNAQRVADLTVGQWCIENQMFILKNLATYPDIGDSEFKCPQLGRDFTGKQTVKTSANPNFRTVDIKVLDESGQSVVRVTSVLPKS